MNVQNPEVRMQTSEAIESADEVTFTPVIEDSTPAPEEVILVQKMPMDSNVGSSIALLNHDATELLHTRWNEVQGRFVDEPRSAVQQADALVSEVLAQITQMFAKEHSQLDGQWKQGKDVSTEDLRMALQRYRSFFNRLLTV
jgi:hypothetical protein